MQLKKGFVLALVTVFLLNASFALVDIPRAGAQPPASGDWVITAAETVTGGSYEVTNGNIIVRDGGNLVLDGTTIIMNRTGGPTRSVDVQRGGSLTLRNGAILRAIVPDRLYYFYVRLGANLTMTDSQVYDVGDMWGNFQNVGMYLASSSVLIDKCVISHGGYGIAIEDASPVITNSTLWNNSATAITVDGGAPVIAFNNISDNGFAGAWWTARTGIILTNTNATVSFNLLNHNGWNGGNGGNGISVSTSNVTIDNNTITDNSGTGIVVDNHSSGTLADNNIGFNPAGGIFIYDHSDVAVLNNRVLCLNSQSFYTTGVCTPFVRGLASILVMLQ